MNTARLQPIAAAAALGLLLFIVVPASVYVDNIEEFAIAPGALLPLLLAPVLLLVATVIITVRLGGTASFSRIASVLAAMAVMVWVQSYLLVWDLSVFDGTNIDWGDPSWHQWLELGAWAVALAVAAAWHRQLCKPLVTAALALVFLQSMLLGHTAFGKREQLAGPGRLAAATDAAAMARFSPDRNVIHILLDAFQADIFNEIVSDDEPGVFAKALSGFTFFEENLGTFPATHLSLPAMLSGRPYRNDMPLPEYMRSVFAGTSLPNAAHEAGFEVDLVAGNPWQLSYLTEGHYDNAYLTHSRSAVEEAARILDVGLFRAAPRILKPQVYQDHRWLVRRLFAGGNIFSFFYFYDTAFLANVTRTLSVDRAKPVYKFWHLMATHAPYGVTPDCRRTDRAAPRMRASVTAQSRCTLLFVVDLLNRLKAEGAYDNSLIVIVGDHGSHIPPLRYRHEGFKQGDFEYDLAPEFVGLSTPLLAIKPPGATHPFATSNSLTSSTNIAATIDQLGGLGGKLPGTSVFDVGTSRPERHFFGYRWSRKDIASQYIKEIIEYRISGSAYNAASWQFEKSYQPGPTQP